MYTRSGGGVEGCVCMCVLVGGGGELTGKTVGDENVAACATLW